ncbi:hypothetical protein B0H63DRAFT_205869 [Podospora didyma]|uniref:Uncharacterized protein n=1 Tax=Podospora didyma TaxID=330526 RepID=A0AAE0NHC0_9PEZI|nr:hypothetical protein B0H63DRAFT_205869 [Podospora didyma]
MIYFLEILFTILSYLATPLFWTETLVFWILGIPLSSFRMFPAAHSSTTAAGPDGDYPTTTVAHSLALITIMLMPYFLYLDRSTHGAAQVGLLLHPLTRGPGPIWRWPSSWLTITRCRCLLNSVRSLHPVI